MSSLLGTVAVAGLVVFATACGDSTGEGTAEDDEPGNGGTGQAVCESGRQVECPCSDGGIGFQRCSTDGSTWGPCTCSAPTATGGASDTGSATGGRTGGGNTGGATPTTGGTGGTSSAGGATSTTAGTGGVTSTTGGTSGTGGATSIAAGTGGTSSTGGATSTTGGTGGATGGSSGFQVLTGGYVVSGTWAGYAWPELEGVTDAATLEPLSFELLQAGDSLCIQGAMVSDSYPLAIILIHLNEPQSSTGEAVGTWSPAGSTGLSYDFSYSGEGLFRLQIDGPEGYPGQAWCHKLSAASGVIPWDEFNSACWNDSGTDYSGDVELETVMLYVEGPFAASDSAFDFCLNAIGPV